MYSDKYPKELVCKILQSSKVQNGEITLQKGELKVDIDDQQLPNQLCARCVERIESFYGFKTHCEYIDQKLRGLIEQQDDYDGNVQYLDSEDTEKYVEEKVLVGEKVFTDVADPIRDEILKDEDNSHQEDNDTEEDNPAEEYDVTEEEDDCSARSSTNYTEDVSCGVQKYSIRLIEEDNEEILEDGAESHIKTDVKREQINDKENSSKKRKSKNKSKSKKSSRKTSTAKLFECETCHAKFDQISKCQEHVKTHGKQRYHCDLCDRWFSLRYIYREHMAYHQGNTFQCFICSKRYTRQQNLDRHISVFHEKKKGYDCSLCDKSFSSSTILREHQSTHVANRNYQCDICQKRYKTSKCLDMHKKVFHSDTPIQKRKPSDPTRSHRSQGTHPGTFFLCTFCGKKCINKVLLEQHIRTHTGEKPFECEYCQKRFSFVQSLRQHVLIHTGEKPFKCDDCGKCFRQVMHLNSHKLTHTGLKQHVCSVCSKSFSLRGNLTVHMRKHTGETPYKCKYCPQSFYDSTGLRRHTQHHEQNQDTMLVVDAETSVIDAIEEDNDIELMTYMSEDDDF